MATELDNFNKLLGNTVNIYSSREAIRSQLSDFAKEYLEIKTVDLYKTSFLSYVIDILSILTANQLFYSSTIYREFFLITAQLRESVLNLAKWIGYNPEKAVPSTLDVIFTIPLTFPSPGVSFAIPNNFKVYAGDIPFLIDTNPSSPWGGYFQKHTTQYAPDGTEDISAPAKVITSTPAAGTSVQVINNNAITVRDSNGFNRPVSIDTTNNTVSFILPFIQQEITVKQFLIPSNLEFYQFYSKIVQFTGMYSNIEVYVREPASSSPSDALTIEDDQKYVIVSNDQELPSYGYRQEDIWTMSDSGIYTLSSTDKEYVWISSEDSGEIFFGNGILGRQPKPGSKVLMIMYVTKGESGQIIPSALTNGDPLYYLSPDPNGLQSNASKLQKISYTVSNGAPSVGGINIPSLPEIKHNAIVNLRSKQRLVSEQDYNDINVIMGPNFPVIETQPILKRSDIKVNEIVAFMRLIYHDENNLPEIVPTRNAKLEIINVPYVDGKYKISRKNPIVIDSMSYETIFNLTLDQASKTAAYSYVLSVLNDTPAQMSTNQPYYEPNSQYIPYAYIPIDSIDFKIDMQNPYVVPVSISSSSSGSPDVTYPIIIQVKVNHVPSAGIQLFRLKIKTKWNDNQLYTDISDTSIPTAKNWIIPTTEDYDLYGDGQVIVQKYLTFDLTIPDYTEVPNGLQRIEYYMEGYVEEIGKWVAMQNYFSDIIIQQDLSDVMMSTMTTTRSWNGICYDDVMSYVHNVPVILSSYLDDGQGGGVLNTENQRNFELIVIQNLINNLDMSNKRMLTDFINIKFPDTHGYVNNLKYNDIDYDVVSRYVTPFGDTSPQGHSSHPEPLNVGDVFIVNGVVPGYESTDLSTYMNYLAEYRIDGSWNLITPSRDTYVKIMDEYDSNHDNLVLAYTSREWIDVQKFTIPISIRARIRLSPNASTSNAGIISEIKQALIEYYTERFGMDKSLDRSEIITVIRGVTFVEFCDLVEPEIDLRFNYDIGSLTQQQLLDYTSQFIGFTEDSINIDII